MALAAVLKSLDNVDESLHSLYQKKNGVFILDVEGIEEHPSTGSLNRALDRVRDEKKAANKKAEELAAEVEKFKDIDPERARAALGQLEGMEDKKLIDEGKVDELVEKRVEAARANYEKQIAAKDLRIGELENDVGSVNKELADIKIFDAIKDSALGKGARKEAISDIVARARDTWALKDGKAVAVKEGEIIYGKSGDPLTMDEWVGGLASDAAHLFDPNSGGGASGGDEKGGPTGLKQVARTDAGNHLSAIAAGEMTISD